MPLSLLAAGQSHPLTDGAILIEISSTIHTQGKLCRAFPLQVPHYAYFRTVFTEPELHVVPALCTARRVGVTIV